VKTTNLFEQEGVAVKSRQKNSPAAGTKVNRDVERIMH
jgi:hypothetical protein